MKTEARENLLKAFDKIWNGFTETYGDYKGSPQAIAKHFFLEGAVEALRQIEKEISK